MEDSAVVTPPYVARPLRLLPFHGLSIAASRVGEPATARAFARPYRRVPERLAQWQARGALWRDETPALYLHEYTAGGITVRGLVGALDLTRRSSRPAEGAVFPHEGIHAGQADDLARRMDQMQLNPAPILLVHRAVPQLRALLAGVAQEPPLLDVFDRVEQQHRIWAMRAAQQHVVSGLLADSHAVIADGHHRYGAYLRLQERSPGSAADRGLAMLIDQDDTPLFLGAIHRTLHGVGLSELRSAAVSIGCEWREGSPEQALAALAPGTVVVTDGHRWATLHTPVPHRCTTVEVLHDRVLPALTTLPERIDYHHAVETALAALSHAPSVAALLPAPDFGTVQTTVETGRLLPEKATSFQPKPSVGVLMRSLLDG